MSKENKTPTQKLEKRPNKFIKFSSTALQMGLTIYFGNALGIWLDEEFQTDYLETAVTLFAIFASMYLVISQVIQTSKEHD